MTALAAARSVACPCCGYALSGLPDARCPECGRLAPGDDPRDAIDARRCAVFLRGSFVAAPLHALAAIVVAWASAWRLGSAWFAVAAIVMVVGSMFAGAAACHALPGAQRWPASMLWARVALWLHAPWLIAAPLVSLVSLLRERAHVGATLSLFIPLLVWCAAVACAWACWRWSWCVGVGEEHGAGLPRAVARAVPVRVAGLVVLVAAAAMGFVWVALPAVA